MTDSERIRHRLLTKLREILGDEEAAALMENLPPHPWSELATKDDFAALETRMEAKMATKDDLATLEARMEARMATKDDLATQVAAVSGEIRHLGDTLVLRMEAHEARTEALVRERVDAQTKLLLFSILGALLTTAAIAIGAAAVGA